MWCKLYSQLSYNKTQSRSWCKSLPQLGYMFQLNMKCKLLHLPH